MRGRLPYFVFYQLPHLSARYPPASLSRLEEAASDINQVNPLFQLHSTAVPPQPFGGAKVFLVLHISSPTANRHSLLRNMTFFLSLPVFHLKS